MITNKPFMLSENVSGLVLRIEETPNNSMELIIDVVNEKLLSFLEGYNIQNLDGQPISSLSKFGTQILDEWREVVLRYLNNFPYLGIHLDLMNDTESIQLLQFFSEIEKWCSVTITCCKNRKHVQIVFSFNVEEDFIPSTWHLMHVKRMDRLKKYIPDGDYWEIDVVTRSMLLSRKISLETGLGSDTIIIPLSQYFDMIHPDDRSRFILALNNVSNLQNRIYYRIIRQDLSIVNFCFYAAPIYSDGEKLKRIIGCSKNVTESIYTENKTEIKENRFKSIIENSPDLFLITDSKGRYNYVSPNSTEILGLTPDKMIGQKIESLVKENENMYKIKANIETIMKNKKTGHLERRLRHADGNYRLYAISITPVLNSSGITEEVITIARDVSNERPWEETLLFLGTHDSFLGIKTRSSFWQEAERLEREGMNHICLVVADINGLKLVNDTFGQKKGDEVLLEATKIVTSVFTNDCFVSRNGSDEFAILVYNRELKQVEELCGEMDAICKKTENRILPLSISWGIGCHKNNRLDVRALYRVAERNMNTHKLLEEGSRHSQIITSLKKIQKSRNIDGNNHIERIIIMLKAFSKQLELHAQEFDKLILLALLHDIGMVAIPDYVIQKQGKLTDEEWINIQTHCEIGYHIAMSTQELSIIANEICSHHEHWDGGGYPFRKRGEEIPLLSRIISIVESYDVMTTNKGYKGIMSHEKALEEIRRCSGKQFDPKLVDSFLSFFGRYSDHEMKERYFKIVMQ